MAPNGVSNVLGWPHTLYLICWFPSPSISYGIWYPLFQNPKFAHAYEQTMNCT